VTEQTPPLNPLQAALAAVTDLSGRVGALTAEVVRLRKYGRSNRRFIVIDVVLTVALAAVSWLAADATAAANRNGVTIAQLHQTQLNGCVSGNQTRAQEIQLWMHLATVSQEQPAPHLTERQIAQNKKEVAALLAYIRTTFQPRNCRALYRIPG
jgi:hypothetical protein